MDYRTSSEVENRDACVTQAVDVNERSPVGEKLQSLVRTTLNWRAAALLVL